MNAGFHPRPLRSADMPAAAGVYRTAFDTRLPWLAGLHTPEEARAFWRDHLLAHYTIWGAECLDMPSALSPRRVASRCSSGPSRRTVTRRFYESHGFIMKSEKEGAANEDKEPDVLYRWPGRAVG